ncbi:hypothetical protein [Hymenobacter rigui]|uniref:Uncharacterized protein n=1 Tax=Hymenobacter rigui TaxID=334424 RepID=A0A3R9N0X4_9BACT|nr:hypothetical protein [Hymenobacter rigui]RSK45455.1 hypothetical protein EI291_17820 [Hymenobacter rigui]
MALFNSVAECMQYLETCKKAFPVLHEIIKPGDVKAWAKQLAAHASLDDYLLTEMGNLNLLNISIATGWGLENGRQDEPPLRHYQGLLEKLSTYLDKFPRLKANRSFRGKVKNLTGLSLLTTLSELSLAFQLATNGYQVVFEKKFKRAAAAADKDVDVSATDATGHVVHFEVYMPSKVMEDEGFLDLNEDDADFAGRVEAKLLTKFGNEVITALDGQVFLAVNTAFFDRLRVKNAFSFTASDYSRLIDLVPRPVDGILLFDDDFGAGNSFRFGPLLRKL